MKIIQTFSIMWKKIKELWNIYGGIALSSLIAWWTNWSKYSMDVWASYITLTITCIGLLTFFKLAFTKNKKTKADKVALSTNKHFKNINNALNPTNSGEELGKTLIYSVREGKKFMTKLKNIIKWLWGNKLTLTSIISNLVVSAFAQAIMYGDMLKDFEFFQVHDLTFKIVVTVLCVLWLINNIFTAVTKYGLENLGQLEKRSEEKKQETLAKLTPEQKQALKSQLALIKKQKETALSKIKECETKITGLTTIVKEVDTLLSLGIEPSQEQRSKYNSAKNELQVCEQNLATYNSSMQTLNKAMENIKKKL